VGLIVSVVTALYRGVDSLKTGARPVVAVLTLVVIILGSAAYTRNRVWKDEVTLWQDVVTKSPNKARGYGNLGLAYQSKDLLDEAIEQYHASIKIKPDFAIAHRNLGFAYFMKGRIDKAIEHLEYALTLAPDDAMIHLNLGIAYKVYGLKDKANIHLNRARELKSRMFQ
jgi:tetratricopeptide (TPR) repeat protein